MDQWLNVCTSFCVSRAEFKKLERKVVRLELQNNSIQEFTFPTIQPIRFRPLPGTLYIIATVTGAGGGGGIPSGPPNPVPPMSETWNLGGGGGGGSIIQGQFIFSNPEEPPLIEIVVGERGLGGSSANQVGETGGFSSVSQINEQGIVERKLIAGGELGGQGQPSSTNERSFPGGQGGLANSEVLHLPGDEAQQGGNGYLGYYQFSSTTSQGGNGAGLEGGKGGNGARPGNENENPLQATSGQAAGGGEGVESLKYLVMEVGSFVLEEVEEMEGWLFKVFSKFFEHKKC